MLLQDPAGQEAPRKRPSGGDAAAAVGLGVTDSPDTVLFGGQADFYMNEDLAIGPLLQVGVDDHETILAPSLNFKHPFYLSDDGGTELRPFVQGGVGVAYIEKERRPGDDDELGPLLNLGGGIEVHFESSTYLSSTVMVNLLPGDVVGEDVFLSWQVIQVGWWF